jgi:hypothetical protein
MRPSTLDVGANRSSSARAGRLDVRSPGGAEGDRELAQASQPACRSHPIFTAAAGAPDLPVALDQAAAGPSVPAASWDYANRCAARRHRRELDYSARRALWRLTTLDRVAKCGRVARDVSVQLGVRGDGTAGVRGLVTCGSVWACPVCARRIMAGRADELGAAVSEWQRQGGAVVMVTLTMRHRAGQALADLWDALSAAWSVARNSRRSRAAGDMAGLAGWARVVEATHGEHGWHLHVHALLFVRRPEHARGLGEAMFDAWAAKLSRLGLDAPLRDRGGLDVRGMAGADVAGVISDYLAKSTLPERSPHDAARELTGQAAKRGRRGNRTPFGVLADLADRYELRPGGNVTAEQAADKRLWCEWEAASQGRRALTWSEGVRELLELAAEVGDVELAEVDDTDTAWQPVAAVSDRTWRELRWRPDFSQLLDLIEDAEPDGRFLAVARWLIARGLDPPGRPREVDPPALPERAGVWSAGQPSLPGTAALAIAG